MPRNSKWNLLVQCIQHILENILSKKEWQTGEFTQIYETPK